MSDPINHPSHYGGVDNPYEAIKVIEAWGLGFNLGNCVKYICRMGKKARTYIDLAELEDLKKARFYLDREIQNRERPGNPAAEDRGPAEALRPASPGQDAADHGVPRGAS